MGFQIPTKDKKWIQANKSDVFGNLFSTWNMDFDIAQGKVRVSHRVRINTDSGDDADLGVPWAFLRTAAGTADQYWAGCGAVLFKTASTDPTAAFAQDAIASTPTTLSAISSDLVEFNSAMIVSDTTDLHRLASGSWTANWWTGAGSLNQSALTSGIAHPLHVTQKTNTLLIGDSNLVHAVDKNNNVKTSRLILPTGLEVIWIRSTPDGAWIGARHKTNGEAICVFWDEVAENYNRPYGLKSDTTFAGVVKDGLPYTVNGSGQLLGFNGVGFDEVAVFPIFEQPNRRMDDGNTVRRNVQRNGMAVIDEKIHINICSQTDNATADVPENFPSGIWTYDKDGGLRHKYALSQYDGTEIDYGSFITVEAGALIPTTRTQGLFLVGGRIPTNNGSTILPAIFYKDTTVAASAPNRGHFVTTMVESDSFEDLYQDLNVFFKRFGNTGDKIIVKYRVIKNINYPIEISGTWASTTTFTATSASHLGTTDAALLAFLKTGDEVMVTRGRGSGTCVKISSVSNLAGTYTITIAEAVTNASGTMWCIVNEWIEAATISTQGIARQGFYLDAPGTAIQLKVEMRSHRLVSADYDSTSPELERIIVTSKPDEII